MFSTLTPVSTQFTYNPGWLEDEEASDDEGWDIAAYRKEKEEEDAREEERLIRDFNSGFSGIGNGGGEEDGGGGGGGDEDEVSDSGAEDEPVAGPSGSST